MEGEEKLKVARRSTVRHREYVHSKNKDRKHSPLGTRREWDRLHKGGDILTAKENFTWGEKAKGKNNVNKGTETRKCQDVGKSIYSTEYFQVQPRATGRERIMKAHCDSPQMSSLRI
jgi:hypothetical protein